MAANEPSQISAEMEARFWGKVDVRGPDECWPWTGTKVKTGYGSFKVWRRMYGAHRFALELSLGQRLDSETSACHRCDNPPCCNPDHLFAGTRKQNAQDALAKGRLYDWKGKRDGEDNPSAKLTTQNVISIRMGDESAKVSAIKYGVSETTIRHIRARRSWRSLP